MGKVKTVMILPSKPGQSQVAPFVYKRDKSKLFCHVSTHIVHLAKLRTPFWLLGHLPSPWNSKRHVWRERESAWSTYENNIKFVSQFRPNSSSFPGIWNYRPVGRKEANEQSWQKWNNNQALCPKRSGFFFFLAKCYSLEFKFCSVGLKSSDQFLPWKNQE